jgi:hypothetical protein
MPLAVIKLEPTLSAEELEDEIFRIESVRVVIRVRRPDNVKAPWSKPITMDEPRFMSYAARFKEPARAKSKPTIGRLRERILTIMHGSDKGYTYQFAIITRDGYCLPGILSSHVRQPFSHGDSLDLIRFPR